MLGEAFERVDAADANLKPRCIIVIFFPELIDGLGEALRNLALLSNAQLCLSCIQLLLCVLLGLLHVMLGHRQVAPREVDADDTRQSSHDQPKGLDKVFLLA